MGVYKVFRLGEDPLGVAPLESSFCDALKLRRLHSPPHGIVSKPGKERLVVA